jgi:hypothetical protein
MPDFITITAFGLAVLLFADWLHASRESLATFGVLMVGIGLTVYGALGCAYIGITEGLG